ncbi:MAG: 16S rRNA (cytidine(1402)-2'-O)-methyltransferase [Acidobacteria bacterium]|nr:MAG: 16S rRNA (cytidine(1402)-2'-O)-methyltransferase [Acidobacteriota bacterium]
MSGTLFVVATPIGNLEDITARAVRVLGDVALIAAEDTRRTAHLLARYAIKTPSTSLHEHNEAKKTASLIARLQRGDSVALVSDAGTPGISDPGQRLIRDAIAAGIRVEAIPGPNAAVTALAASGFPADRFTFLGFPPTRSNDRAKWFAELQAAGHTVVFYEAPHRVRGTLEQILATIGDCDVLLGRELTKTHEELVRGPISAVLGRIGEPRGEFTLVIDIGRMTKLDQLARPTDAELVHIFGDMTINRRLTRRQAVTEVARRYQRSPNEVYAVIERAKKLAE